MSIQFHGNNLPRYDQLISDNGGSYHPQYEHLNFESDPRRSHNEPLYEPHQSYSQRLPPTPTATPNPSSPSLPLPQEYFRSDYVAGITMERTPSGTPIFSSPPPTSTPPPQSQNHSLLSDIEAGDLVERNISLIYQRNKNVRYLLSILSPTHPQPIDDLTLRDLLHLFNILFFHLL